MDYHQAHKPRRKRYSVNRFLSLASLLCLGLLAGCNVYLTPTPTPVPVLNITEFTTFTNYTDQSGASYICDNRPTTLTYRFSYEGRLERWTSYLEGQALPGSPIKGEHTFDPRSQDVSPYQDSGFEVEYRMDAYFAPYKEGDEAVSPQAIIPVPNPQPIGATKLYLTLEGQDGQVQSRTSEAIPVVSNCP